jgi:beta-mannosidase
VAVLNDTDQPWQGEITITRERFDGETLAQASVPVDVGPRSSTPIAVPAEVAAPTDPGAEIVTAQLDGCTAVHTFAEDLDLALDPDPLQVTVDRAPDGYAVTVTARTLARDVTLHPDHVAADAAVDDALVTLRAGERATFQVRTNSSGLEQALAAPPVLRTANDLQRSRA